MQLDQLLIRYSINGLEMDTIASAMLEGIGLEETAKRLQGRLTPEQVFAVASSYAKEQFEDTIGEICPQMMLDRMEIQFAKKDDIERQIRINTEMKKLRAIEDDLLMLEAERAA
jgi:hypothetical protein